MVFFFHFIVSATIKAIAFWYLATELFPTDFFINGGVQTYILLAVVFGFLNTFIMPVLKILTLPIRFLTLGLFSFVLNGILLWMTEKGVNFLQFPEVSVHIQGWMTYLIAGLLLSIISATLHWILKD